LPDLCAQEREEALAGLIVVGMTPLKLIATVEKLREKSIMLWKINSPYGSSALTVYQ